MFRKISISVQGLDFIVAKVFMERNKRKRGEGGRRNKKSRGRRKRECGGAW